jgi:diguanylate cyclase
VLRHLAERLIAAFPESDVVVARTGGEEFGLILRDYDEISTMIRTEAFREALEAEPIVCAGIEVPVTVSIGVGSFHADRDIDDDGFYGAVDVALYAAKQQGRNRVVSVSMLEPGLIARRNIGRTSQPPRPRPRMQRNA